LVTIVAEPLRRGQLHWVWLGPVVGSEQAGRRPAVIVSSDELLVGSTAIVVPLSSHVRRPVPAYQVLLPKARTGLPRDSVALCHQVRTVSISRFVKRVGRDLGPRDLASIDDALRYVMDLEHAG
jgi:mRNA interferase MazF